MSAYILRTCRPGGVSHGGFVWPRSGRVECLDWRRDGKCGHGLHGLLNGAGDAALLDWASDAEWLVARVEEYEDLGDKVKFPIADVLHVGNRKSATDYLIGLGVDASRVVGAFLAGGNCSTLTGGYHSTLTGGYYSTLTGGDGSTLTGGNYSTLTGGYHSTLTGGDYSTLTVRRWDGRYWRLYAAYVGEGGIKAGQPYRLTMPPGKSSRSTETRHDRPRISRR